MTEAHGGGDGGRSLGEWVRLVLRRWPILVVAVVIGALVGLIAARAQPTLYEARTTLVLSPATGVLNPDNATDLPVVAATVARLADDETVSAAVQRSYAAAVGADPARDLEWFQDHVEARVPTGTSLVQITAQDATRERSGTLAGVSADALIAEIRRLTPEGQPAPLNVTRFGATADLGQVSPRRGQSIVLWANAALLLGIVVALTSKGGGWAARLRNQRRAGEAERLDEPRAIEPVSTGYARNDVIELDRTTLERFASIGDEAPGEVLQLWNETADSGASELRHRVTQAARDGRNVVGVIGSARGTVLRGVATELASHLALGGASCVVIDANFHPDPGGRDAESDDFVILHRGRGLGDVLDRAVAFDAALVDIPLSGSSNGGGAERHARLALLPAGNAPIDPLEALTSSAFRQVLAGADELFDHVIVVAPPARWQKESVAVAGLTDGNLMVLSNHLSLEAAARPLVAIGLVKPSR